jgi:hypothetical protein
VSVVDFNQEPNCRFESKPLEVWRSSIPHFWLPIFMGYSTAPKVVDKACKSSWFRHQVVYREAKHIGSLVRTDDFGTVSTLAHWFKT